MARKNKRPAITQLQRSTTSSRIDEATAAVDEKEEEQQQQYDSLSRDTDVITSNKRRKRNHNNEILPANNNKGTTNGSNENKTKAALKLQEEILLLEQSLESLQTRKRETIDRPMAIHNQRRKAILEVLTTDLAPRKQQLEAAQVSHYKLLGELQTSLSKSRDILLRLEGDNDNNNNDTQNSSSSNNPILTREVVEVATQENRIQEETTNKQQLQQDQLASLEQQQLEDKPLESLSTSNNPIATVDEEIGHGAKELSASSASSSPVTQNTISSSHYYTCPISSFNVDPSLLQSFWGAHGDLSNPQALLTCLPSAVIGSGDLVAKMMDIYASEALAEDARLLKQQQQHDENENQGTVQAMADYRRQSLWNTCLDLNLMAGRERIIDGGDEDDGEDDNSINETRSTGSSFREGDAIDSRNNITANTAATLAPVGDYDEGKQDSKDQNGSVSSDNDSGNVKKLDQVIGDGENSDKVLLSADHLYTGQIVVENDSALHLNPNITLCPYELGGICADPFCPYQHLDTQDRPAHESVLPRELIPLPSFKLPPDVTPLPSTHIDDDQIVISKRLGGDIDGTTAKRQPWQSEAADASPSGNKEEEENSGGNVPGGVDRHSDSKDNDETDIMEIFSQVDDAAKGPAELPSNVNITVAEKEANTDSSNTEEQPNEHQGASAEDFESNMDFIAFDDNIDNDALEDDDGDEDMLNLETVGLVGLATKKSEKNSDEEADVDKKPLWWLHHGSQQHNLPTRLSLEDWMSSFGEFYIVRDDRDSNALRVLLEYRGSPPRSPLEALQMAARVVDCVCLMLHSGRFDLAGPMCRIVQTVLDEFTSESASSTISETTVSALQLARDFLQYGYSWQNGIRSTYQCQLGFAVISDFLLQMGRVVQVDSGCTNKNDMDWCKEFFEQTSSLIQEKVSEKERGDFLASRGAHYIRETVKLALFRKEYPSAHTKKSSRNMEGYDIVEKIHGVDNVCSTVSCSLLQDIQDAIAFAAAVRSNFSVHSMVDEYLKPIWSLVKAILKQRKGVGAENVPRSTSCLRSCIFICYIILGMLEGTVDYLKTVDGDPQKLSALIFSSLVQLDVSINGILKSLKSLIDSNFHPLVAPVMAASVSFSCHLGFYTKAQQRLEEFLDVASNQDGATENPLTFLTYSELLWSQVVHLRASLPFTKEICGGEKVTSKSTLLSSEIADSHRAISTKVHEYGVHLHHLCLAGDWMLLQRIGKVAQSQRPTEAAKHQRELIALLSGAKSSGSLGLRFSQLLPEPSSLRMISSRSSNGICEFPRTLLVYGANITHLDLSRCQLHSLPHTLGLYMANLRVLRVSNNNLEVLPESLGNLKLTDLVANRNKLKSFPLEFHTNLTSYLRVLDLRNNDLASFPRVILNFKKLEVLRIRGNIMSDWLDSAQLALELPNLCELLS